MEEAMMSHEERLGEALPVSVVHEKLGISPATAARTTEGRSMYRSFLSGLALILALALGAAALPAGPGEGPEVTTGGRSLAELNSSPIQDNSFLVEEAYNQEDGVIQHISFFERLTTGDWAFTQTDEWPLRSLKHQLSLTLVATEASGYPKGGAGWGDTFINYRYQLVGNGDARLAIAPRFSLLLPTGNPVYGRGLGGAGVQFNLPISVQLSKRIVSHWNVGTTWVPRAQNDLHQTATSLGANLGQSMVWLVNSRFNALLETVWTSNPQVVGPGMTLPQYNLYISPGVRWSHNFKNGLQIVPGIGLPVGVGPTGGQLGMIFYLSFEHGFRWAHSKT
jgi:hypothetical protein